MPRRLAAVAAAACCLAVAVAGCDSGPSVDPDADEALIEDALLTVDDLPDGFEEVDADDDGTRLGDECNEDILGLDRNALDDATSAETDPIQFDSADASVRAQITAFESAGDITRVVEGVGDNDYVDCLAESLEDDLDQGTTLVDLDEIDSPFEDRDAVVGALGVRLEINNEATSGIVVEAESQQHGVVVDRFGISLQVTAEAGQIDDDLVEELLDLMVERVRDGLDDA